MLQNGPVHVKQRAKPCSTTDRGQAGERPELAETAGKIGEGGLPAPSHLAIRLRLKGEQHEVPRWNFGFFASAKMRAER